MGGGGIVEAGFVVSQGWYRSKHKRSMRWRMSVNCLPLYE
jgi:hypothetical protein